MTEVLALPDADAAARRMADQLAWRMADARRRGDDYHVALAGGGTPRRAYELLGEMEGSWDHVHLWMGDERCVPLDDPESNHRMVQESLYGHARAQPPKIHPVQGSELPEDAAWLYARELYEVMDGRPFDLVLLGIGEDAHVASLFPGDVALDARHAPVVAVRDAPKPPPERVTLTLPVLRGARRTVLLAAGEEKRDALRRAVGEPDPRYPASLLGDGLDQIICDEAAAP